MFCKKGEKDIQWKGGGNQKARKCLYEFKGIFISMYLINRGGRAGEEIKMEMGI